VEPAELAAQEAIAGTWDRTPSGGDRQTGAGPLPATVPPPAGVIAGSLAPAVAAATVAASGMSPAPVPGRPAGPAGMSLDGTRTGSSAARHGSVAALADGARTDGSSTQGPGVTGSAGTPASTGFETLATAAAHDGRPGSPSVPEPVLTQIAKHLATQRALRDGTQHTVLRLAPEHLGALTLTLDVRGGAVHLAVAGSEAALATLRDGLAGLRQELSSSGLDLADVTLRQDTADPGQPGAQNQQASPGSGGGGRRDDAPGETAPGPDPARTRDVRPGATATAPPRTREAITTSIDVRV
jgi:hypothetical protein